MSNFAAYISASDLHFNFESLCKIQIYLLHRIPRGKPPERILEYMQMETANATQSLLADLGKSEDLYDAQKSVHIVDALITNWSLRCCPPVTERGGSKISS